MRNNIFILSLLMMVAISGAIPAQSAEVTIRPTVTVMEEFNDNIYEAKTNRKVDLISHVIPGVNILYRAPLWDWNVNYSPEFRTYARKTNGDQLLHNLALNGIIRPVDNLLYVSISDTYSRTPIDGNRENLFINQTDQNIFTISPYLEYHLDSRWTAKAGYRYVNRYYSNAATIGNQEHGGFLRATRELNSKSNVYMDVDAAHVISRDHTSHNRLTHTVGGQYLYAAGSSVNAQAGYSIFYPSSGKPKISPYWNIGLTHQFNTFTFNLNGNVSYDTESNLTASERRYISARLSKAYQRGTAGIFGSYSETINSLATSTQSKWFTIGADAGYDITRLINVRGSISTDKYINSYLSRPEGSYRNSFIAGIRYELNHDLFIGLDYNRIAYSNIIFNPSGPIEVNRVMLYLTKTFQVTPMVY